MQKLLVVIASLAVAACAGMGASGGHKVDLKLTGAEEVPAVSVAGSGTGSFVIAADGSVTGSVTTEGVQGTMAHIHMGAPGKNGPVIIPLVKSGDTYSAPAGAKLSEAQMQAFKEGKLYVNVHTAQHKGGEVRAQLQP
jgi:CHRD domain